MWTLDRLLRPLAGIIIFSAAYMEEVRWSSILWEGKQYEAAMALGSSYAGITVLGILPEALTLVIPGIVNNFIGLFMDTTLISIVGATDFLEAIKDPVWAGPTIMVTGYVFAGIFYFAFCFGMARSSAHTGRVLAKGRK